MTALGWASKRAIVLAFLTASAACKTPGIQTASVKADEGRLPPADAKPPKVWYHVGKKKHVDQNVKNNGITPQAWAEFVFGGPRFPLPLWRRGYYGSSNVYVPMYYGQDIMQAREVPWIEVTTIRDECLTPDRIFRLAEPTTLTDGTAFMTFFEKTAPKHFASAEEAKEECMDGSGDQRSYNARDLKRLADDPDTPCEKIVDEYLAPKRLEGPRVVFDDGERNSWYARELACLESIKGTPDDLLPLVLDYEVFWRYASTLDEEGYTTFVSIVLQTLAESTKAVSEAEIGQLVGHIRKTATDADPDSRSPRQAAWTYLGDQIAAGQAVLEQRGLSAFRKSMAYAHRTFFNMNLTTDLYAQTAASGDDE